LTQELLSHYRSWWKETWPGGVGRFNMQPIAGQSKTTQLKEMLEQIAGRCDPSMPHSLMAALSSLLSAMEYNDKPLVKAALEETCRAFADAINEAIAKRLGWPAQTKKALRYVWDEIRDFPRENWDELGAFIDGHIDEMLRNLSDLARGPARLLSGRGYVIENLAQLQRDIAELETMKQSFFDSWPWSTRELPPVEVTMLEASMAAIRNGKPGVPLEDLIRRLGGELPCSTNEK